MYNVTMILINFAANVQNVEPQHIRQLILRNFSLPCRKLNCHLLEAQMYLSKASAEKRCIVDII